MGADLLSNMVNHVVGNVAGMYMFREWLRGTAGQRVIACWLHIQAFRKMRDERRRLQLFHAIRRHYLKPVQHHDIGDTVASGQATSHVTLFGHY
jgi:hypothetical protein